MVLKTNRKTAKHAGKLKKGTAMLGLGFVLASGVGIAAPAANDLLNPSGANAEIMSSDLDGAGALPFFAYVKAGERVYVNAPNLDRILDENGAEVALPAGNNGVTPIAQADGVWRIYVEPLTVATNSASWEIEVQDAGSPVLGRVWATNYQMRQLNELNNGADLSYYFVSDAGFEYEVELFNYNGVNSNIRTNSLGTVNSNCVPLYRSVELDNSNPYCGDNYRTFFDVPASDLPEYAKMGNSQVPVVPAMITAQEIEESVALSFEKTSPGTNSMEGDFSYTVDSRFTGGLTLQIDVNGNGVFTDPVDRVIRIAADGNGDYVYHWNGLDGQGNVPDFSSGQNMNARLHFDKMGEIHLIQTDVEGRGGVTVNRLNGPPTNRARIFWDDRSINRPNPTPVINGTAGVNSNVPGGVHGWAFALPDGGEGAPQSWGDQAIITDWAYVDANISTEFVPLEGNYGLEIIKTADKTEYQVGDTINYNFAVTNTGTLNLTNIDVNEVAFSGSSPMSEIICNPAEIAILAPGTTINCTASYVVTQADMDAGKITNSATAVGTPEDPNEPPVETPPSIVEVPGVQNPNIAIEKTASVEKFELDEEFTYNFKVTNTGNVTLTNVNVEETEFTGSGKMSEIICAEGALALAPGEAVDCTAKYTPTVADMEVGHIDNIAIAHGDTPIEDTPKVTSPEDDVIIPGNQAPGIAIVKTADREKYVLNDTVNYNFEVTNTGNITLNDVKVVDYKFTGAGKMSPIVCPTDEAKVFVPKNTMTCTSTYVVQQADLDKKEIVNTAYAEGTPIDSDEPIKSDESTVTITHTPVAAPPVTGTVNPPEITTQRTNQANYGLMGGIAGGLLLAGGTAFVIARKKMNKNA